MKRAAYIVVILFGIHASASGAVGFLRLLVGMVLGHGTILSILDIADDLTDFPLNLFFEHPTSSVPDFFSASIPLAIANSFVFGIFLCAVIFGLAALIPQSRGAKLRSLIFSSTPSREQAAMGIREALPYLSIAESFRNLPGKDRFSVVPIVGLVHLLMTGYGNMVHTATKIGIHYKPPEDPNAWLVFHRLPLTPYFFPHKEWETTNGGLLALANSFLFAFIVWVFLELMAYWASRKS